MNKHTQTCLSAIPFFIIATIAIWVFTYKAPQGRPLEESDSFVRHFIHQGIFSPAPESITKDIGFKLNVLKPGDIIFGHNPGSSYGYWTHCAIYLGEGKCSQQNLSDGMYISSTHDFEDYYKEVKVFRAPISDKQAQQICDLVEKNSGSIFDMSARKQDPRLWTCAKLCWAAYKELDIELCPDSNYVLPDFIIKNVILDEIAHFPMEAIDAPAR